MTDTPDATAPLLSVIVTSYNIEAYLPTCLDGILAQDVDDMEIIVVDDGSTDASPDIIRSYAARDARVVPILFEENTPGGVATAANAGLDRASGTWIGFADGDDVYYPDMFATLLDAAAGSDVDLVMCDYLLLDDTTGERARPADAGRWTGVGAGVHELDVPTTKSFLAFIAVPWRKLYRRELIEDNDLRFPVGDYFYEDNPFHWFSLVSADRIATAPKVLCEHRVARVGQTMQTADERLLRIFQHHDTIRAWLDDRGLAEAYGSTLLTWVIAQLEWISRSTPPDLQRQLYDAVEPIVAQYSGADVQAAFRESGKGPRSRSLVRAVVERDFERFRAVLEGGAEVGGPIASGLYHLRNTGVKETAQMTRRYLANKARQAATSLPDIVPSSRSGGGKDIGNGDLMLGLMALDRRVRDLQAQVDTLVGMQAEPSDHDADDAPPES